MVKMNTTDLSKSEIEEFTFQMAYHYYGFTGPVKVPSSVMYAHKIAKYCEENKFVEKSKINGAPNQNLMAKYHYL